MRNRSREIKEVEVEDQAGACVPNMNIAHVP